MAGVWRALVLVVGLAAMACVAQRSASYEEIVTEALQIFNHGQRGQPLFGLLEALPPPSSVSVHGPRPGQRVTPALERPVRVAGRGECLAQALAIVIVRVFLPSEGKKGLQSWA